MLQIELELLEERLQVDGSHHEKPPKLAVGAPLLNTARQGAANFMKLLHVALIVDNSPQTALRNALRGISTEYVEYDWCNRRNAGADTSTEIRIVAQEFQPDVTFLQLQDHSVLSWEDAQQIPGFVVTWNGDVRNETPAYEFELGKSIDLSLHTNMRDVENLRSAGVSTSFLQIGYNQEIYNPNGAKGDYPEIVFLGSNFGNSFPLSEYRREMVRTLDEKYGGRAGVFGHGWAGPNAFSLLNEQDEAACYRSCKIAINLSHFSLPKYSSDRLLRIMGAGAFCLSHEYPEMEHSNGEHLITWDSISDLIEKIDFYLQNESERSKIAAAGCAFTRKNCSWDSRIAEFLRLLEYHGFSQ